MTKPKLTKLFAVAVLAAATPAIASPDKPASQQQASKPRTLPNGRPACGNTMGKARRTNCEPAPVAAAPIKPRALPNGKPACGNTMSKTGDANDCKDVAAPIVATAPAAPIKFTLAARRVLSLFGLTDLTRKTPVAHPREFDNGKAANGNIPSRRAAPVERHVETPRETPREPNAN